MPPTFVSVLILIGTLCTFFYIFRTTVFRQNHDKNGRKLPPGPCALPIIRNIHVLEKLPHQSLHHLAKRYGLKCKLQNTCLMVPRAWLLPSTAHLRSLVESVKKSAVAGEVVDLSGRVGELIGDIMSQIIFGLAKDHGFNLKPLIDQTIHLHRLFNISDFIPYLAPLDIQGIGRRLKRTSKLFDIVFEKIIDEHLHGTDLEGLKPHKDFVDMMISMLNQPMNPHDEEQPYIIERNNVKAILLDMTAASFDISAVVIVWAFSEILRHPSDDSSPTRVGGREFLPERFIGSNIDPRGHDFELTPFGSGRRGCPGMQLALITVRLVLAQLIHCFDWESPDGMQPNELDMSEIFGLSLPRANHLLAKPTYRLLE
ncbi:Cytochrome P450 superfamily protein, putative isoform 2 [Hibiscus syriacus]|uniref:Cytochrome P450 superfamily protein, putative isoform 2 n=1 Tax=Hibiscus syriacus TaxID=106335 RepID=A0A6A3CRU4_HIBSY|nr:Cytochrome P450 superfamily protein, putative isoform 2 [Hibiscus syriacus]